MLSVGMFGAGGEDYYLAVGDPGRPGPDEYYRQDGQVSGVWMGSGAPALGLSEEATADQVRAVMAARHPATGELLVSQAAAAHRSRTGMYLTFSPPKGVSLLALTSGDDTVATMVREAHAGAVADTLAHLEREALYARRGRNGATRIATGGFVAAGFEHTTSRSGDPQLHTHVLAANVVQGVDGRWSAPDSRSLFGWSRTAGSVYQAALRDRLTREVGLGWRPVRSGMAEPDGIPDRVLRAFSTRRRDIEDHLAGTGGTTAEAAQRAALATRAAKDTTVTRDVLAESWRIRLSGLGTTPEQLVALVGPGREPRPLTADLDPLADHLLGSDGLTAGRATFGRADVVRAVAETARTGASPVEVERAADRILGDERVVHLTGPDPLSVPAERRFTTTEMLAVEAHLADQTVGRQGCGVAVAGREAVEAAVGDRPSLTAEQRRAVERLTTDGDGIAVLVGRAGAGKTFALDAARAAWTASGVRVVGAAPTARAAAELESGSGVPSTTLARLLTDADTPGEAGGLPRGGVVIVDEAGMAGTRTLDRLAAQAERDGTKLVLVGDPAQLPEIDAGGSFAALARATEAPELVGNRRQSEAWERQALAQLRAGHTTSALEEYRDHDRVRAARTAPEAREAMVADWRSAERAGEEAAMFALRRADVDSLNRLARHLAADDGELTGDTLTVGSGPRAGWEFQAGDRVVALRNNPRLGLLNGTRGRVDAVDPGAGTLDVTTTAGASATVPAHYLTDGHLDHGYALTLHKAQGATVDRAFLLGSDALYREAGYVGMSRGRTSNVLYTVADPDRDLEIDAHHARRPEKGEDGTMRTVADRLADSRAQRRAVDTGVPPPSGPLPSVAGGHELTGPERRTRQAAAEARLEQADRLARAALTSPPPHLTDILGPPPPGGLGRSRWAQAARTVEAWRHEQGIAGPDPLGPRPGPEGDWDAWDHARAVLDRTADQLRQRDLDRGLGR